MAMKLMAHNVSITYRNGLADANADGLGRQAWSLEEEEAEKEKGKYQEVALFEGKEDEDDERNSEKGCP